MLALIAGQGDLPAALAARLDEQPFVASLEGFAPDGLKVDQHFRIEHLGSFLAGLTERGVKEVCFAGAVKRPRIDPSQIDAATMPLVPAMMAAMGQGDDAALRAVIEIFEGAGLGVCAAHEIAPDLLPAEGAFAGEMPESAARDIARGRATVAAMGAADIGQACVVVRGQVIAVEGLFGTDWMLRSLADRPDDGGGILYKAPKPDQDRRMDLPTIGLGTVEHAARAGLDGIVIAHGGVMVLDQAAVAAKAQALGLFVQVEAA